jgi:hypothetical protein
MGLLPEYNRALSVPYPALNHIVEYQPFMAFSLESFFVCVNHSDTPLYKVGYYNVIKC